MLKIHIFYKHPHNKKKHLNVNIDYRVFNSALIEKYIYKWLYT